MITREQVERALRKESRYVRFEVHYADRDDPVTYDKIGQINFERAQKVILVFPPRSGTWLYVGDGDWVSRDRKKVRR